jgi:hypothetical protein
MRKVKYYLPKVKANRYTYYNLSNKAKKDFQKLYNYLKSHKEKLTFVEAVDYYLIKDKYYMDYLRKYKTMEAISQTIKH